MPIDEPAYALGELSAMEAEACQWLDSQASAMCEETIALAAINSGSFNAEGVNAVGQRLQAYFGALGGIAECLPVKPWETLGDDGRIEKRTLGQALRIRKRPEAALQIFLCGHLDTVFPQEHGFQNVQRGTHESFGEILHGPGVADLKGGLVVMRNALLALERSPLAEKIGWEVLLNPDEEIGSQSSMGLIEDAARRCDVGLIYEPSFPDGHLAGARKGSGNFAFKAIGRAAHAGREHHLGRNAIRALCDAVVSLDQLNGQRPGVTFNPGYIHGGGAVNIVPDLAIARFNIRMEEAADMAWCEERLQAIVADISKRDGVSLELYGGFTRPPKPLSRANEKLFEFAECCGRDVGVDIRHLPTGGCCDGNNLAAFGVPNIDTLGVHGGDIHSDREWMRVSSLPERAKISALMLLRMAEGGWQPEAASAAVHG